MKRSVLLDSLFDLAHKVPSEMGSVVSYAVDLVDAIDAETISASTARKTLLNGAWDELEYSYSGFALIYDEDIARRILDPLELIRYDFGRLPPPGGKTWLDLQAKMIGYAITFVEWSLRLAEGGADQ